MKKLLTLLLAAILFTPLYAQKKIAAQYIADTDRPTLIMFTADWCLPCQYMKNRIFTDSTATILLHSFNIVLIDVDSMEGSSYQKSYCGNNTAIPQLFILDKNQNIIGEQRGASNSPSDFITFLSKSTDISLENNTFAGDISSPASIVHIPAENAKYKKWEFGPEAGIIFSKISGSDYNSFTPGYYFGATTTFNASSIVAINMGAYFNRQGGRLKNSDSSENLNYSYVTVPVDLNLKIVGILHAGFGIYGAFRTNSSELFPTKGDFGLRLNISAETGHFRIKAGYSKGAVNLLKNDIVNKATNSYFRLGAEYAF